MRTAFRAWIAGCMAGLLLFSVPAASYRITDGPTDIEASAAAARNAVEEMAEASGRTRAVPVGVCVQMITPTGFKDFPMGTIDDLAAENSWLRIDCQDYLALTWTWNVLACGTTAPFSFDLPVMSGELSVVCVLEAKNGHIAAGFFVRRSLSGQLQVTKNGFGASGLPWEWVVR